MAMTRRTAAGLIVLGLASPAWTQPAPPDAEIDETSTEVGTSESRSEHMLAPVMINDQGPFNFLMDTGANTSCISQRVAQRLSLPTTTPAPVHTMIGTRVWPRVIIDKLQVGNRTQRRVRAPSLAIRDAEFDGVLGVDWLKGQRLMIDFAGKSLEIGKSRYEDSEKGRVFVPARRRAGQLTIIDADLGGRRISALIDTGAEVSVCNLALRNLAAAQDRTPQAQERSPIVTIESLTGEVFNGRGVFLPFVRLGGLHLGAVPVVHADVHVFRLWDLEKTPALVLGMDLLTQFRTVALDYGRSTVRFDLA